MNKTACLISCSDHYSHRMHLWDQCLQNMGYSTQYITSNFDHTGKKVFTCPVPGCIQLPVRPYRKNLSLARILSHRQFARGASAYLEQHKPDLIVGLLPPNLLARELAGYKKKHPEATLIFDIFDLWPETFPSEKAKRLLGGIFRIWAGLRDKSLPLADHITTECDLFRRKLRLSPQRASVVPLWASAPETLLSPQLPQDRLSLCYLGAINNVIGIHQIAALLSRLCPLRPVTLHIIGAGEQQQSLIDAATAAGAEVCFHGPIYDDDKKQEILRRCHFGLNIMKPSVCVGLTMKSVEYFRFGLPILNNIPGDTAALVDRYQIGLPADDACPQALATLSQEACLAMRQRVLSLFSQQFSQSAGEKALYAILNQING